MSETTAIHQLLENAPRWAFMWLLAGVLFFAGKAAAAWPVRRRLEVAEALSFALLWVGMDARPFLPRKKVAARAAHHSLQNAAACLLLGALLLWGLARHFTSPLAQGWCGMIGLILMLHFGSFSALAVFWNARGVRVRPIMNHPAAATALAEFWGRRWNVAFRDLAHPMVFLPVAHLWGRSAALWASFAFSGLIHELVISVPAGGGFGLPTAYFLLQALGITLQGGRPSGGLRGWCFTHAFTVLPACILFHPPFVERVMIPFFHAIGALP